MDGDEAGSPGFYLTNGLLAEISDWLGESKGVIVNAAAEFLEVLVEIVSQAVVEFGQLHGLRGVLFLSREEEKRKKKVEKRKVEREMGSWWVLTRRRSKMGRTNSR